MSIMTMLMAERPIMTLSIARDIKMPIMTMSVAIDDKILMMAPPMV